jgi:hypothetical protein
LAAALTGAREEVGRTIPSDRLKLAVVICHGESISREGLAVK